MIDIIQKYSKTQLPDKHGRWQRIAYFKKLRIGYIDMVKERFVVKLLFPTKIVNEVSNFDSFTDALDFLAERWEWFIEQVKTK